MAVISDYSINNRYKDKKNRNPKTPLHLFHSFSLCSELEADFEHKDKVTGPMRVCSTVLRYTADASDNIVPY